MRTRLKPTHQRRATSPFIVPKQEPTHPTAPASPSDLSPCGPPPECVASSSRYRPWAELLKRTFGVDVETCPRCGGRMRLLAVITDLASAARLLRHRGQPTEPPTRAPARDPPYCKSQVQRRRQAEHPGQSEHSVQLRLFEEH